VIAIVIWIAAWFIGGAHSFDVGDSWFWFLVAASVLSVSQALATSKIGQTTVLVNNPPQNTGVGAEE